MLNYAIKILILLQIILSAQAQKPKTFNMATVNWEPYYANHLQDHGYFTELVKEALNRSNIKLKMNWVAWKRALDGTLAGRYDGVLGAYFSEQRAKEYHITQPIAFTQIVLFKRKDNQTVSDSYKTLQELKKYKIGVTKGFVNTKEFDTADYLNKSVAVSQNVNIRKLLLKRVPIIVGSFESILYKKRTDSVLKKMSGEIMALDPPLEKQSLHVLISKKSTLFDKKTAELIDKNISKMKKDGTFNKILLKHGMMTN